MHSQPEDPEDEDDPSEDEDDPSEDEELLNVEHLQQSSAYNGPKSKICVFVLKSEFFMHEEGPSGSDFNLAQT